MIRGLERRDLRQSLELDRERAESERACCGAAADTETLEPLVHNSPAARSWAPTQGDALLGFVAVLHDASTWVEGV